MICRPFSVVVVPFPFTDRPETKRRPALVLSEQAFNRAGHTLMAMITSKDHAPWPGDTPVTDLESAGLPIACLIRLKVFTLDNRLIVRRSGCLAAADQAQVIAVLRRHLAWSAPSA